MDALELLAWLAAEQDSYKEAIRLWAAADSQRTTLGYRLAIDRDAKDAAKANQTLGQTEFEAAWTRGAELSTHEAIAYAARGRGARKRPAGDWASLTPSELEVVRLVAEHLSPADPERAAAGAPQTEVPVVMVSRPCRPGRLVEPQPPDARQTWRGGGAGSTETG